MIDEIEQIISDGVPAPAGHYSHATAWKDLVFASGQLGARGDRTHTADRPFETQVRQALRNVLAVLAESGCGPDRVLRVIRGGRRHTRSKISLAPSGKSPLALRASRARSEGRCASSSTWGAGYDGRGGVT